MGPFDGMGDGKGGEELKGGIFTVTGEQVHDVKAAKETRHRAVNKTYTDTKKLFFRQTYICLSR
jgi:hypothetical protein